MSIEKTLTEKKPLEIVAKPEIKKEVKTSSPFKNVISRQKLLEHGVHFGHKKNRWNPKMKSYIQGIKHDTHIINLEKTVNSLNISYKALYEITKKGGKVLFVGTKKQVSNSIKLNAIRSNSFYVNHRWLGGTLTNFNTIKRSVERYKNLERLAKDNFNGYSKKESVDMYKDLKKMELSLGGIKFMRHKPAAVIISSSVEDNIALKEAQKLKIPVFSIIDTNSDPDGIQFKIPANDDANKSQALIMTILSDAICDVKGLPKKAALLPEEDIEVLGINPRIERPEGQRYSRRPQQGGRRTWDSNRYTSKPNTGSSNFIRSPRSTDAKSTIVSKPITPKPITPKPTTVSKPITKPIDIKTKNLKPVTIEKPITTSKPIVKPVKPVKPVEPKPTVKKEVKKPIVKKEVKTITPKPIVKKEVKTITPKPTVKKEVKKPIVKKEVKKPIVKKEVKKPTVKKEVKTTTLKPIVKKPVKKPTTEIEAQKIATKKLEQADKEIKHAVKEEAHAKKLIAEAKIKEAQVKKLILQAKKEMTHSKDEKEHAKKLLKEAKEVQK